MDTTDTELSAIAAPAITGFSMPSRRERDAEHVVDEGEEQILPDFGERGARERDRVGDPGEIVSHQRDVGDVERRAAAGGEREARRRPRRAPGRRSLRRRPCRRRRVRFCRRSHLQAPSPAAGPRPSSARCPAPAPPRATASSLSPERMTGSMPIAFRRATAAAKSAAARRRARSSRGSGRRIRTPTTVPGLFGGSRSRKAGEPRRAGLPSSERDHAAAADGCGNPRPAATLAAAAFTMARASGCSELRLERGGDPTAVRL